MQFVGKRPIPAITGLSIVQNVDSGFAMTMRDRGENNARNVNPILLSNKLIRCTVFVNEEFHYRTLFLTLC